MKNILITKSISRKTRLTKRIIKLANIFRTSNSVTALTLHFKDTIRYSFSGRNVFLYFKSHHDEYKVAKLYSKYSYVYNQIMNKLNVIDEKYYNSAGQSISLKLLAAIVNERGFSPLIGGDT